MPIHGVGTDIVETQRIRDLHGREPRFARRVFTNRELDYSFSRGAKYLHLAARFAAKEAVAKALGGSFAWKDVEVVNSSIGRPEVSLHGRAKAAAGNARVHLSLSHTRHYACAVAVVEDQG
jgi:holo-[acyl-carrier protein] synthase